MNCPRRFLLVRFHAEDLAAAETEAVQEHLVDCGKCREILEGMEYRQREFLDEHPFEEIAPVILAEVKRRERSWRGRCRLTCPLVRIRTWWS